MDTTTTPARFAPAFDRSFGALGRAQTYRNVLYLVIAFPLGAVYFAVLTTGFLLGVGLAVALVGVPILVAVGLGSRYPATLERELANGLLGLDIPRPEDVTVDGDGRWSRIEATLLARSTWKGVLFLYLKLPLGIASFTLVVASLGVSVGLLTAPFTYGYPGVGIDIGVWAVDTFPEALLAFLLGVVALGLTVYVIDLAAGLSGEIARFFLS